MVAGRGSAARDGLLIGVILLRTTTWFGLITFVPLWAVSLGHTKAEGNRLLSLMLVSGIVGALVIGPVADRVGLRRTLLVSTVVLSPLVLAFVYVGGVPGTIALALVGMLVVGTFGVVMVLEPAVPATARRDGVRAERGAGRRSGWGGCGGARSGRRRGRPRGRAHDLRA